jgi:hypothetical protein
MRTGESNDGRCYKRLGSFVKLATSYVGTQVGELSDWHSSEAEGRTKALDELMQGTSVLFRYYLSTGGSKDMTFSLVGARPAIAQSAQHILTELPHCNDKCGDIQQRTEIRI